MLNLLLVLNFNYYFFIFHFSISFINFEACIIIFVFDRQRDADRTSETTHERYCECDKYLTELNSTSAHQFYFSFKMNQ